MTISDGSTERDFFVLEVIMVVDDWFDLTHKLFNFGNVTIFQCFVKFRFFGVGQIGTPFPFRRTYDFSVGKCGLEGPTHDEDDLEDLDRLVSRKICKKLIRK